MKHFTFLLLYALLGFTKPSIACSCWGPDNFCETLGQNYQDVVVLAVKETNQNHGMRIKILEVLSGMESRQEVVVWGDNGFLCRHYVSNWNIGDTVIFALDMIDSYAALPQEDSMDYQISVCGTYVLNYANGLVSGAIDGVEMLMPYNDFKNTILTCSTTTVGHVKQSLELSVFPNPISSYFHLTFENLNNSEVEMRLFSLDGKVLMYSSVNLGLSNTIQLQVETIASGIYLLEIQTSKQVYHNKIVIQ